MPVNTPHPVYSKQAKKWNLVRHVIDNDLADSKLMPDVDPNDAARSLKYKNGGVLTNFTKLTLNGLIGLVFRKESTVELPDALEYLEDDATGDNVSLEMLLQQVMMEILKTGRCGLMAELPQSDPDGDDVGQEKLSYVKMYTSESIINWRYKPAGNSRILSLVVLQEMIDVIIDPNDIFTVIQRPQYRVLRLDENGYYIQEVYNYELLKESVVMPEDYNGKPFTEIPFVFIGSESNDANCDPIPLYDLAILNFAHFRNSCDFEESVFVCGQPCLFLTTDIDEAEFKLANPNGIRYGSRTAHNIGPNSQPWLLQASPNQLADAAMARKEEMAIALGARFISNSSGRETAEAARIRYGAQNSSLQIVTYNIADGVNELLEYVAMFMMEIPEESIVTLNDEYYDDTANPLLIAQQIMLLDRGVIGMKDIRDSLRDVGVIADSRTDEEVDSEVNVADPMVGVNPVAGVKADGQPPKQ
jgi:hypothetical protein